MVKKSHASMVAACVRRNCRQVASRRCDAGGIPQLFEHAPDGSGADPIAQAQQLALNPLVSPAGILPGHALHLRGERGIDRRPAAPARVGPLPADQPPVPAQQRRRGERLLGRFRPRAHICEPRDRLAAGICPVFRLYMILPGRRCRGITRGTPSRQPGSSVRKGWRNGNRPCKWPVTDRPASVMSVLPADPGRGVTPGPAPGCCWAGQAGHGWIGEAAK
jgi:hypothetical protein